MEFRAFPKVIESPGSGLRLEAYSRETQEELWAAIALDRLDPRRRGIWPTCSTFEDLAAYMESCRLEDPKTGDYAYIIRDGASALVGTFHIHSVLWNEGIAEVGYWIHHSRTGQGFATRALRCAEDMLFRHGFRLIEIRCPVWNHRSWAVAERAAYRLRLTEHEGKSCASCDECVRVYEKDA